MSYPQIKTGVVQRVKPEVVSDLYQNNGSAELPPQVDVVKALVDPASPLTIANAGVARYDGNTADGVYDSDP